MIDLRLLFEPRLDLCPFASFEEELAAVVKRTKAISRIVVDDVMDSVFEGQQRAATAAGLLVTISRREKSSPADQESWHAFFSYPEELWRIRALELVRARLIRSSKWSDELEGLESSLLGYSEEQTRSWLRQRALTSAGPGATLYIVMSDAQRLLIERLGSRCLDPGSVADPMLVFFPGSSILPKRDIDQYMPQGMCIARFSIDPNAFARIFDHGSRREPFLNVPISDAVAVQINKALTSTLQFNSGDQWT